MARWNGQSIASIIERINSFTRNNKEVVILDFSHGLNTDNWTDERSAFTQQEWEDLLDLLCSINYRIAELGSIDDLTILKLSQLIDDSAVVIIVIDATAQDGSGVGISCFASEGFFTRKQFPLYNGYPKPNDQSDMIQDQLQKLETYAAPSSSSSLFLLLRTLTQGIPAHCPECEKANWALIPRL